MRDSTAASRRCGADLSDAVAQKFVGGYQAFKSGRKLAAPDGMPKP
jgi:hypothetical protein